MAFSIDEISALMNEDASISILLLKQCTKLDHSS